MDVDQLLPEVAILQLNCCSRFSPFIKFPLQEILVTKKEAVGKREVGDGLPRHPDFLMQTVTETILVRRIALQVISINSEVRGITSDLSTRLSMTPVIKLSSRNRMHQLTIGKDNIL